MKRVQRELMGWAAAGAGVGAGFVGLAAAADADPPEPAGPIALALLVALGYLVVSNTLLARALRRHGAVRFGQANAVTSLRSTLVGLVTGLVVASFVGHLPAWLIVLPTVPALALDAVDGWVARRTGSVSEVGGRFDMEVDAFLLLVLSAYVAPGMGGWVLAIGLLRYAFVAAGWVFPWVRRALPSRYWRKVVTAFAGIALTVAASGLALGLSVVLVLLALALLLESFGRDVIWLARRRSALTEEARPETTAHPRRIAREPSAARRAALSGTAARSRPRTGPTP